jgi:hypothetical protein
MTGWFAVLVVILAAANPAALAGTGPAGTRRTSPGPEGAGRAGVLSAVDRSRLRGVALGLGVVAVIALGTDAILDALSVSASTFRTAAGAVIGIGGAVEVLRRHKPQPTPAVANPLDLTDNDRDDDTDLGHDDADDGDQSADDGDNDLVSGLLATLMPPLVFAAITMSTDDAWWLTAVALAAALALTVGLASAPPRVRIWARIAFGGLAVGMGILLVSAGIRAV